MGLDAAKGVTRIATATGPGRCRKIGSCVDNEKQLAGDIVTENRICEKAKIV